MSYLLICVLFAYSGVQRILYFVFLVLCTLCCQFLWITPSVFSNNYFISNTNGIEIGYFERFSIACLMHDAYVVL